MAKKKESFNFDEFLCWILFFVWMLSWFLAVWIYHMQLFLTGIIAFGFAVFISKGSEKQKKSDN